MLTWWKSPWFSSCIITWTHLYIKINKCCF